MAFILNYQVDGTDIGSFLKRRLLPSEYGKIGTPGTIGFGVGVCPPEQLPPGMTPMAGYDELESPNFGNYLDALGSHMVFIPKFWYKINNSSSDLGVGNTGGNYIHITDDADYAATYGFALERCFVDDDITYSGIFVDKYCMSNVGDKAISVPGAVMLLARGATTDFDEESEENITSLTHSFSDLAQSRWFEAFHAHRRLLLPQDALKCSIMSTFAANAITHLAWAHSQYSSGLSSPDKAIICAWRTVAPYFPKGNTDPDHLQDEYDSSVVFTSDPTREGFTTVGTPNDTAQENPGLAGSGAPFERTTHNGQRCGIADVAGKFAQLTAGCFQKVLSGVQMLYILKSSVNIDYIENYADSITEANHDQILATGNYGSFPRWLGNGANQVFGFSATPSTTAYKVASVGAPLSTGVNNSAGVAAWGYDYVEMNPASGGGDNIFPIRVWGLSGNVPGRCGIFARDGYNSDGNVASRGMIFTSN
jgi:hypothetical protein